jgi:hypothetical protein
MDFVSMKAEHARMLLLIGRRKRQQKIYKKCKSWRQETKPTLPNNAPVMRRAAPDLFADSLEC